MQFIEEISELLAQRIRRQLVGPEKAPIALVLEHPVELVEGIALLPGIG